MRFICTVLVVFVFLIIFAGFSKAFKYKAIFEDDEIFNECQDQPNGVLNVHGLLNFSELTYELNKEEIFVYGNFTSVWDIQPNDRIQITAELLRFDRGSWQPTVFSLNIPNLCPILYDKNQYWYDGWIQHLKNINAVKDKCLLPGTKFIHNPFTAKFTPDFPYSKMDGLYKIVVTYKAFNYLQIPRPTSICYEIKLELNRV